jgi:hypothetical protein
MRRTEVWISREEMVDFLLYEASLEASPAMRSKMSLTKELQVREKSERQRVIRAIGLMSEQSKDGQR